MTFLLLLVLGGDIGLTQSHQVIYVIAGIKEQTAYCRVRNLIIHDCNGTHMQFNHLLHILHLLVLGKFHALKYAGNHLHAHIVVVVECPAVGGFPLLGARLADVMQQRRPAQPQVAAVSGHVVQHLKCMEEHILVAASVDRLHALQCCKFREYQLEQSASVQINESLGRNRCQQYLVEFFRYALLGYYVYTLAVLLK